MTQLEPAIAILADAQGGLFTTAQATRLGISEYTLGSWVKRRHTRRILRGVYAVSPAIPPTAAAAVLGEPGGGSDPSGATGPGEGSGSPPERTAAEAHHLLTCRAAQLLYSDSVLTGTSALLAHGLPVWGSDLSRPYLRRAVNRGRGVVGVHIRRPSASTVPSPYGLTVPLNAALAEHAADHGIIQGVVSADAAVHRGLTTAESLTEQVHGWMAPGSSRARAMVRLLDGRSESVGESRLRCLLTLDGFEMVPQVVITGNKGEFIARVDGILAETSVALEFDGKVKYAAGDPGVLYAEKQREDRLRSLGWTVVRVTWADLENPRRLFAKLHRALAAAA